MDLTSPRVATLKRLYHGAMTARACASVRGCADAGDASASKSAPRASSKCFDMVSSFGYLNGRPESLGRVRTTPIAPGGDVDFEPCSAALGHPLPAGHDGRMKGSPGARVKDFVSW